MATAPGNTYRFDVEVDNTSLGEFTAVDGLTAEYDVQAYEEGGENGFVHKLPGRLKFQNIKVSRPLDGSTNDLAAWFSTLSRAGGVSDGKGTTAHIKAYNDNKEIVRTWNIKGVFPVKYTGPSFSTEGPKVAVESLELAHTGFFEE